MLYTEMKDCYKAIALGWGDYMNVAIIWYYQDDEPTIVGIKDVWYGGHRMGVETLNNSRHARPISNDLVKAMVATATSVVDLAPHYLALMDFGVDFFAEGHAYGTDSFKQFCETDNNLKYFKCDKGFTIIG